MTLRTPITSLLVLCERLQEARGSVALADRRVRLWQRRPDVVDEILVPHGDSGAPRRLEEREPRRVEEDVPRTVRAPDAEWVAGTTSLSMTYDPT